MKVAIQGIKGSFHHIVAESYFSKNIELAECMTFSEMPNLLKAKKVEAIVMAIENSIAGSLLPNYALIDSHNLEIVGEFHLLVQQNLMALKGQKIEDIKEVYSHPMALLQCAAFFENYPYIKLIEDRDTADVAKRIYENKLKGIAAIASTLAAEIYELAIIAPEIQTIKNNATRFFILNEKENRKNKHANKASIRFTVTHEVGSLGEILIEFSKNEVNLSKIQSMPVIDEPWRYAFFADLVFKNYDDYQKSLNNIASKVKTLKILGEYTRSKR